jgi:chitodextrinase
MHAPHHQLRNVLALTLIALFPCAVDAQTPEAIIIDHHCTQLDAIPEWAIQAAKDNLCIAYGHTSHGSQIPSGMSGLATWKGSLYAWNGSGSGGALRLIDYYGNFGGLGANDLGSPNRSAWASATRAYLDTHTEVNVIIWSWCGQVDGSESEIQGYLDLMNALESDYAHVQFVYMTGHLNGGGTNGNVNVRNNQIRDYCRNNGTILFDFADIESYDPDGLTNYMELLANDECWYDSDQNGSRDRNWASAWQDSHTLGEDWFSCSAAHSQPLNGNLKAYAAWHLWARLAGWDGGSGPSDTEAPTAPTALQGLALASNQVNLSWEASTDNIAVEGYRILRDGVQIALSPTTSYTDTSTLGLSTYLYRVIAYDAARNNSDPSQPVTVNTPAPTHGTSAFQQLEAEDCSAASTGVQSESCSEGGSNLGWIQNDSWIRLSEIDFGNGASSVRARVASGTSGGNLEFRLDSITGTLIASASTGGTGGWQNWTSVDAEVNASASGIHHLFVVFKGAGGYLMNLNWIEFSPSTNHAPELNPIGNRSVPANQILQFAIQASDADNDPLEYSASNPE